MGRTTFQVGMLNRDLDLRGLGGEAASLKLVFVPLSNTANRLPPAINEFLCRCRSSQIKI